MLLAANGRAVDPGLLMAGMGLASLLLAGFMLYRRRDMKRFFAYSSIEHMGIIAFAFGIGGPLANFAGLLHMAMHSLTKSAIFFAVGRVAQLKGTQKMSDIGGLAASHPGLGWGLAAGILAIAGLPPFGVFMSEFLVVTSSFADHPVLTALLALGLLIGFGALMLRLSQLCFGEVKGETGPAPGSMIPTYAHLALVLVAGIWLPPPVVDWFRGIASMLG
jgi:hydrogenase-4 component F